MKTPQILGILGILAIVLMSPAAASVTINSCVTIPSSDVEYILEADLFATDSGSSDVECITAAGALHDVIINCQGHKIYTTSPSYQAIGHAESGSYTAVNLSVINCVFEGFQTAIDLTTYISSSAAQRADYTIEHNTFLGGAPGVSSYSIYLNSYPAGSFPYKNASGIHIDNNNFLGKTQAVHGNMIKFKASTFDGNMVYSNTTYLSLPSNTTAPSGNYFYLNSSDIYGTGGLDLCDNASGMGNYWLNDGVYFSETCSSSDGSHCDNDYTLAYNEYGTDYYPLKWMPGPPPEVVDLIACGNATICLTFRDNVTYEPIPDVQVNFAAWGLGTGWTHYSDENGQVILDGAGTGKAYQITATHTSYYQYTYPSLWTDSETPIPLIETIYLTPLISAYDLFTRSFIFTDVDNQTKLLASDLSIESVYDLGWSKSYYAGQPDCYDDAAENLHDIAIPGIYNNVSFDIYPAGCVKLTAAGGGNYQFYDPETETSSASIEDCQCDWGLIQNYYVVEDDPYISIRGIIYSCDNWSCVRSNSWTRAGGVSVSLSGSRIDNASLMTYMSNVTGAFEFNNVLKNDVVRLQWAKTGYETNSREIETMSADVGFPHLYLYPLIDMPEETFNIYGYVTTRAENGSFEPVKDVDIFGVYSTALGGLRSNYLNGATNLAGFYNFTFTTNRYPQPIELNFNVGAYDDIYDSPVKTITISNSSSGRHIRADVILTGLTFEWSLIVPVNPAGCNPLTDPSCIVPSGTIQCVTFNGSDCSNRSWAIKDGYARITGLDCGTYTFKTNSEYIQENTFNYVIPCSPGAYYINNGTATTPPVVGPSLKKVSWISLTLIDNSTNEFITGASVTICPANNQNMSCETQTTSAGGSVRFLKDEGTYSLAVSDSRYKSCIMPTKSGACVTGSRTATTPPAAYLNWYLVEKVGSDDIWAWLEEIGIVNILKLFFMLGLLLALIKIAQEYGK